MSKKDDFWKREAAMTRHRMERHAYREAQIEALFTEPCEREDCLTHQDEPCPGCGRRWSKPNEVSK